MTWGLVASSVIGAGASLLGGGGGKSADSTGSTVTNSAPWEPQQQYILNLMNNAQSLYDGGQLNAIAQPSDMTISGRQNLYNAGIDGDPAVNNARGFAQATLNGNYLWDNPTFDEYQGMANASAGAPGLLSGIAQSGNPYLGQFAGLGNAAMANPAMAALLGAGQSGGYNPANAALSGMASGYSSNPFYRDLSGIAAGNANPYLDSSFNQAANAVQSRLQSDFASHGRFGSGAQNAALADAYNNLANQIYGGAYQSDANNRLAAAQAGANLAAQAANNYGALYNNARGVSQSALSNAGSLYDAGVGNALSAATNAGNLYNSNLGTRAGAAQGLGSLLASSLGGLSGDYTNGMDLMARMAAVAPNLAASNLNSINAAVGAGAQQDAYQQSLLNAQYDALRKYQALIQGNYGNTQVSNTSSSQSGSPFSDAVGGVSAGLNIYNRLFGNGGTTAANNANGYMWV